jgi:hypothetical protein
VKRTLFEREATLTKKNGSSYLICFIVAALAVAVWQIAVFFEDPNAFRKIGEFLIAIGACAGVALLLLVCFTGWVYVNTIINEKKYNRVLSLNKDYLVRCHAIRMADCNCFDLIPIDLPEEPDQEARLSVNLVATRTTHGLCITALSKTGKPEIIAGAEIPFGLFGMDSSDSFIVPLCYITLSCIICEKDGGFLRELSPSNSAAHSDKLSEISSDEQLLTVVLFRKYVTRSDPRKVKSLGRPLKLKMFAVDDSGNNDASATWELYVDLYTAKQPSPSDDADSWMYHSRPIY